jgi:intermediate peptidase
MPWDLQYYIGMAKSKSLNLNSLSLSAYFPLGSCMEGLNVLFQSLYGISLEPEEALPGELWSPEVQKIGVVHEKEGLLGYIYCDFLVRPHKIQQDSHFTIRG